MRFQQNVPPLYSRHTFICGVLAQAGTLTPITRTHTHTDQPFLVAHLDEVRLPQHGAEGRLEASPECPPLLRINGEN